ncbi:MAG: MFS transporter [Candidatus Kaiserbacteria bacterium]|nr:MFS transporter [Candidatus Kaiserbacteria bacterium]MCB9816553.1 MFS transporter [Candidatus Nomurabacteria bacterium]
MQSTPSLFNLREINPVIRLFIVSDFFIIGGLGLITPIFALFITDFIQGATIETVGVATAVYLVTRSVGQLPIGILIDRWKGQKDDMIILLIATFGFAIIALLYSMIDTVLELYAVQFIFGLLSAASYPTWYAVFTRSIDEGKEGFEWSAYQTIADFSAAITAAVGSYIAAVFSFDAVFYVMASFSVIGAASLVWASKILLRR